MYQELLGVADFLMFVGRLPIPGIRKSDALSMAAPQALESRSRPSGSGRALQITMVTDCGYR